MYVYVLAAMNENFLQMHYFPDRTSLHTEQDKYYIQIITEMFCYLILLSKNNKIFSIFVQNKFFQWPRTNSLT